MSTNFYFKFNKTKELTNMIHILLKDNLSNIYLKKIENILNQQIHICQISSYGVLFQKTKYFKTVKELLDFYEKNEKDFDILDEYGKILSKESFKKNIINDSSKNFNDFFEEDCKKFYIYRDEEGFYFRKNDFV